MPVYVAGGGGTHLEPRVTSHYLAALIAEGGARGVLGTVTAVKTQQSEIDAPLDDLVVNGRLPDGTSTRLDLQVTTTLSFTESDDKWTDIVPRAWSTFRRTGFNANTDRIGVGVSQTTTKLERSVQPLLARARHAVDAGQYRKRLAVTNGSNNEQREFQRILDGLIRTQEATATDEDILAFMKSLTIIAFDLDQEDASRDRLASIDQLAPVVDGPDEARRTWSSLTAMASRVIPSGGGVDRAAVARELQVEGVTVGSDRAHARLIDALNEESRHALTSIRDTIGGRRINRDVVNGQVLDALTEVRLVRVVGQHGAGKSAVLKRVALDQPEGAPILVLRDLRVTGGGWPAHVAKFGPVFPLATTLREMGLGGARTLFIDGADKMDAATQVTINDLLRTIADTTDLDDWRIVMTMREEGAQRVDGWLDPEANAKLSSRTIRVEGFDDQEAVETAEAIPLLRPLLADARNYDTVLRRPFFLDALSRLPVAGGAGVRSEVDLVELWWTHGGADVADFAPAQGRRNVLLKLGEQLLVKPGAPLPIRDIDPVALDELLRSGVLRHVDEGSTVAFSHDIYEEWVLERDLFDRRADIATAVRDGHQDLQLARPLQLLAAHLLERSDDGDAWAGLLDALGADDLRATWSRVVLSAPVRSVRSAEMLDRIGNVLLRGDGRLLGRLILSIRTTETVRDLRFLDEAQFPDLTNDQREQYASEAAGPQIVSWIRLITWLVPRLGSLPRTVDAELVPLFDSWVQALPAQLARHALVPDIAAWALERLGSGDTAGKPERGSWTGGHGDRASVRSLLLKCAAGDPDTVRSYLASISDYAMGRVRKQIVDGSAGLAASLPAETAAFVRRAYLLAHNRRRRDGYSTVRDRADVLGIGDDRDFYPASPLRPPFLQLLRADADVGLGLIRDLCNHAMEGWRRSWSRNGETPIPITIDLGDGDAEFWGDDDTYRWFRGGSHVHILDTALLALDAWAHERLAAGNPLDELCRRIARGNECNAVLGICAGLVFADLGNTVTSTVSLAIGTHPALWTWDIGRSVLDMGSHSNEIGYWGSSAFLAGALRTLNRLPHRQRTVRDLAPLLAGLASDEVKAAYAAAIATFLDRVPYSSAEERDDTERAEARRTSFEALRQQADPANLVREIIDGRQYISIKPPYAESEAHQEMLAGQAALNRVLRLYLWASAAVKSGAPGDEFTLDEAFDEMVALDEDDLFDEIAPIADMTRHNAQSAVSATAAVIARHAEDELWASSGGTVVGITRRAATVTEVKDELSSRGAHVTGHPPAMAAHAYAALIRRQSSNPEWREGLLQLAVDPIEKVVEAVYDAAPVFAGSSSEMVWALFCLATQRAARTHDSSHGLHWSPAEAHQQSEMSEAIERALAAGEIPIPDPAPASAGSRPNGDYYRSDLHANAFRLPIPPMLTPATRDALVDHAASALDWALASLGEKDGRGDTPYEWLFEFGRWLGRLCALLPTSEIRTLVIARVDAAVRRAADEVMDMAVRSFMIDRMLRIEPLDAGTIESWDLFTRWIVDRPVWASDPVDAGEHERGLAVSSFFCAVTGGMVCGIDAAWPNLDAVMPMLDRAAITFGAEKTAFNAMLALLRARPDRLLPDPGLGWIGRVVRARKSSLEFWEYTSNGEKLVLLLRDLIAARTLEQSHREIVVEVSDALIELGVKGAAFLQQDLVRHAR